MKASMFLNSGRYPCIPKRYEGTYLPLSMAHVQVVSTVDTCRRCI